MKKWISCLLALTLLLTACAGQAAPPSSQGADAPALEEDAPQKEDPTAERVAQEVKGRVSELTTEDFVPAGVLNQLALFGITADVTDVAQGEGSEILFTLTLSHKNGDELTLPLTGQLWYDIFKNEYDGKIVHNPRTEWGSVNYAGDGALCISTLNEIAFYNVNTLQPLKMPVLDLSYFGGRPYWLLAAAFDGEGGLAVAFADEEHDGYLLYDKSGALKKACTVTYSLDQRRTFYEDEWNTSETDPHSLSFPRRMDVVQSADGLKIFCHMGKEEVNSYSPDTDQYIEGYVRLRVEEDGWQAGMSNYPGTAAQLALLYHNGELENWMVLSLPDLSPNFNLRADEFEGVTEANIVTDFAKKQITIEDFMTDSTLTLDFAAGNASLRYDIRPEHVEGLYQTSPNGLYSLGTSSFLGAGDVGTWNIVLRDNLTGRFSFVACSGGMYGGYSNMGFFRNNDVYYQELTSLRIYSPENTQDGPFFRIEDNFPLGELPDKTVRYLFTFRRDPQDMTWLVLYAEGTEEQWYHDEEERPGLFLYSTTYRIGSCAADGTLLESWDTGEKVASSSFGLLNMSMRVNGDKIAVYSGEAKGSGYIAGVYDRTDGTYTSATKEELREQGFVSVN